MKKEFLAKVSAKIEQGDLLNPSQPVLVALSGGADSVALLLALQELGFECVAAHCNFHLRGEESDRDEAFVRALCRERGVPCVVTHFDVPAYQREHGVSMEMACRELRYEWFEEMRVSNNCQAIAVAHHSDDNVETFFLNLFRGTGMAGLTGMKPRNGLVVRPLLEVSRSDIEAFLAELGQDYVTDSTNSENVALRNRLRNVVLPAVDQMFPEGRKQLLVTMEHLNEYEHLYCELINQIVTQNAESADSNGFVLPYEVIAGFQQKSLLLYEIARPYGMNRTQCEQAIAGQEEGRSGYYYSGTHYMHISRGSIIIRPLVVADSEQYPLDFSDMSELPVILQMRLITDAPFDPAQVNGTTSVAFDASILQSERVVLRHWQEGDSMVPFGMHGHKLLSDLFTDNKLDKEQKKNVWILEADGVIVWVLGIRAANAFKVQPGSTDYILLSVKAD
ncbi:MAG: tRNA lysidine(34) synthetase TilS [Muribaculaceae bacterium]|nr:tRNA lysidine(34) synthetase TilS [Muribaculaceae bacterium]